MKKNKVISIILIVSLLLMGVGYAAWTDTLTITNTVATGNLQVEFEEECGYPVYYSWDNKWLEKDYFSASLVHDDKNPKITVTNMYPGSRFWYEMKGENVGSIPVKVDKVTVDLSGTDEEFDENIKAYGWIIQRRPGEFWPVNVARIRRSKLSKLETVINDQIKGWELQPGDYLAFDDPGNDPETKQIILEDMPELDPDASNCLYFNLPLRAGNETENLKEQVFSINFEFVQFNN